MTKITINNKIIEYDSSFETTIQEDLTEEMDTISSRIAYFGELLGEAHKEKIDADSIYRSWRAKLTKKVNESDPKLPEWKVKAKIESHENFRSCKTAMAECEKNVKILESMVKSLIEKSQNIRSKGARLRLEYETTDMDTKYTNDTSDTRKDRTNENLEKIRKLRKNKS